MRTAASAHPDSHDWFEAAVSVGRGDSTDVHPTPGRGDDGGHEARHVGSADMRTMQHHEGASAVKRGVAVGQIQLLHHLQHLGWRWGPGRAGACLPLAR